MNILCIGQSTLDISLPLDQPLIENQKFRVFDKLESAGGPSTTAAILLGQWGMDVTLVTRLGNDIYATHILDSLKAASVKHRNVPNVGFQTPISVILTNKSNGNRTILNCPGQIDPTDMVISEKADFMLCDAHEPELTHRYLDQHPDVISILDAGGFRQPTVELAKRVTWLVCSQGFAEGVAQKAIDLNDPSSITAVFEKLFELNKAPIVTLGDQGCLYTENGIVQYMPAFPAKAIDTNGAGDIFHGAFVYGLAQHMPLKAILTLASMTSAISVTRRGGSLSIPALQEVLDALGTTLK